MATQPYPNYKYFAPDVLLSVTIALADKFNNLKIRRYGDDLITVVKEIDVGLNRILRENLFPFGYRKFGCALPVLRCVSDVDNRVSLELRWCSECAVFVTWEVDYFNDCVQIDGPIDMWEQWLVGKCW